ncbi:MAG TPA: ECF transporter S component [bacterium]|jgi:uncharacterized membrane protein|nr:ECF transporter S component [bacterium]
MQMRNSSRLRQPITTRQIAYIAVLAAVYVVLGQLVRFIPNPMVPGAIIALNMVVVVIAGILLGPVAGTLVGLIGTGVNAISPAGNAFEVAAIIPHGIMGLAAGLVGNRVPTVVAALTILVGHVLNVLVFIWAGLMPANQMTATIFSVGLLAEVVVDVVVIVIAVPLLRPLVKAT